MKYRRPHCDGGHKECVQNLGRETSWKISVWILALAMLNL
jgi:hypothetical protein